MNALIENTLLKMGVGWQTMPVPKVPARLKNIFKKQTPLEKLNQERMALGYQPLTQSEWLASAGVITATAAGILSQADDELFENLMDTGDEITADLGFDHNYAFGDFCDEHDWGIK